MVSCCSSFTSACGFTRSARLVVALVACTWMPLWRGVGHAIYGHEAGDTFAPWYASWELESLPLVLACLILGWLTGSERSLAQGVTIGLLSVAGYALLDNLQPEAYFEPVTWESFPFHFFGGLAFCLPCLLLGAASRALWNRFVRRTQTGTHEDNGSTTSRI